MQSRSEGDQGFSQDLREIKGSVRISGRSSVQSGSEGYQGFSQDLRDIKGSVRV